MIKLITGIICVVFFTLNFQKISIKNLKVNSKDNITVLQFKSSNIDAIDFIYLKVGEIDSENCNLETFNFKKGRPSESHKIEYCRKKIKISIPHNSALDLQYNYFRVQLSNNKGEYSNILELDESGSFTKNCK